MEEYSLLKILRGDPDYAEALKAKTQAVKKDKAGLLKAATKYTEKYKDEILEGTKLRQKLLTEGQAKGLSEDEIFRGSSRFLPTIHTPILNYLFFVLRDEEPTQSIQQLLEEYIKKFGYDKSELTELYLKGIAESINEQGLEDIATEFEDEISEENTEDVPEQDKFIYGNLTHNEFKKLKKLKALSKSPNEREAFLAYRKCLELCKRHNLEFDKIPCNL